MWNRISRSMSHFRGSKHEPLLLLEHLIHITPLSLCCHTFLLARWFIPHSIIAWKKESSRKSKTFHPHLFWQQRQQPRCPDVTHRADLACWFLFPQIWSSSPNIWSPVPGSRSGSGLRSLVSISSEHNVQWILLFLCFKTRWITPYLKHSTLRRPCSVLSGGIQRRS